MLALLDDMMFLKYFFVGEHSDHPVGYYTLGESSNIAKTGSEHLNISFLYVALLLLEFKDDL